MKNKIENYLDQTLNHSYSVYLTYFFVNLRCSTEINIKHQSRIYVNIINKSFKIHINTSISI